LEPNRDRDGKIVTVQEDSVIGRITAVSLKNRKQAGDKIAMLTGYDFPSARILDETV